MGIEERPAHSKREVDWIINHRRSSKPKGIFAGLPALYREYERIKSQVRVKVEHSFHTIKNCFGYLKTQYRGVKKNAAKLYTLFGLVNVARAGQLLRRQGMIASA